MYLSSSFVGNRQTLLLQIGSSLDSIILPCVDRAEAPELEVVSLACDEDTREKPSISISVPDRHDLREHVQCL